MYPRARRRRRELLVKRVLAGQTVQALLVLRPGELLRHDRRDRRAVGLGRVAYSDGRSGRRRMALQQHRDRQQGHDQRDRRDQEVPIAHVAIEVSEELGRAYVLHGAVVVVAVEVVDVVLVGEPVEVSVGVSDAGPVGVAPAVKPWSAGVR